MKLTEKKLKQMILETMYSPSTRIEDALNDPDVHPKIKDLLSATPNEISQGLVLLSTMYPEKYPFDDIDHAKLGSEDYRYDFDTASDPTFILQDRIRGYLPDFIKKANLPKVYKPFSIYGIENGEVEVSTLSGGYGLMELDAFAQYLEENGENVSELGHEDAFGKRQYLFKVFYE